jgi:hypothetical protein
MELGRASVAAKALNINALCDIYASLLAACLPRKTLHIRSVVTALASRENAFSLGPLRVDAVDKVGDEVVDALICVCGWIERRSSPGSDEIVLAIDGLPTNAVRRDRPPTGSLAAARFDLQAS